MSDSQDSDINLPLRCSMRSEPIDDETLFQRYHNNAEKGHAESQYRLGTRYKSGTTVPRDDTEAAKWFCKAAEQGYLSAQYELGLCYAEGRGVAEDDAERVKWLRKAADQGHVGAQFQLGLWYESGRGFDHAKAVKWFRKAGSAEAKEKLNNLEPEKATVYQVSEYGFDVSTFAGKLAEIFCTIALCLGSCLVIAILAVCLDAIAGVFRDLLAP